MINKTYNIILKIGGSLLTTPTSINLEYINFICKEISGFKNNNLVIIHGGGSLTKKALLSHNCESDFISKSSTHIIEDFYNKIDYLNKAFISALNTLNIPCSTISPRNISISENGNISHFNFDTLIFLLNKQIIPVLHGDIIKDNIQGYYACSSDFLVPLLAQKFNPNFTIFLTDVNGVYENFPPINGEKHLNCINDSFYLKMKNEYKVGVSDMYEKIKQAITSSKFSNTCCIINGKIQNNLTNVINNKNFIGTIIN